MFGAIRMGAEFCKCCLAALKIAPRCFFQVFGVVGIAVSISIPHVLVGLGACFLCIIAGILFKLPIIVCLSGFEAGLINIARSFPPTPGCILDAATILKLFQSFCKSGWNAL